MSEPFYKAGLPKAASGPLGPHWEEGVLGRLLAGKRKSLAGVSFPPGSPVIKKGSLCKFMGWDHMGIQRGWGGGDTEQVL